MRTLVIHPDDRSTDFLKLIYENKTDWTIINNPDISKYDLKELIKKHDRIIMMGHGSPSGLFNPKSYSMLIDYTYVPLLRKKETISIWCNSDKFFKEHNIPGFHTGMIISEVREAKYVLGKTPLNEEETLYNMETFARIINKCIDDTPENMKDFILANYVFDDDVTRYNRNNIIVLKENTSIIYKYIYENNKFYRRQYNYIDYAAFINYKDNKNNLHKLMKENINKVLNKGNKGFILYTKEDYNMDVFKSAINDYLATKIQTLSNQLEESLNLLDEIANYKFN